MSDIICITNRKLCCESFSERIEKIAAAAPSAVILREKDLSPEEYFKLAAEVMQVCSRYGIHCILHTFTDEALAAGADSLHLPLGILRSTPPEKLKSFRTLGASCHSAEEAEEAYSLGCTYIIAGHIFATDCKKGLPPRGTDFIQEVCRRVPIPVYAIGGIDETNCASASEAGASGICIMSSIMTCPSPSEYIAALRNSI